MEDLNIDIFVDSLTDGDLKTLKDNLSRWGDHPRQAVGVLVQGIMFPKLANVHSEWKKNSRTRFQTEGRENTSALEKLGRKINFEKKTLFKQFVF